MKAMSLLFLAGFGACATERDEVGEAAEDLRQETREAGEAVREEGQEAREEIGRAIEEGREDITEARRNLAEELREMEARGGPVEVDAVVTGHDADSVMLRLEDGQVLDVDYGTTSRFRRGEETVTVTDLQNGANVHVVYRMVGGKRMIDEIVVGEPGAPGPGGGTQ